jgi:hypothetical protein
MSLKTQFLTRLVPGSLSAVSEAPADMLDRSQLSAFGASDTALRLRESYLRKQPDTALTSGTFLYEVINLDEPDVFEKTRRSKAERCKATVRAHLV